MFLMCLEGSSNRYGLCRISATGTKSSDLLFFFKVMAYHRAALKKKPTKIKQLQFKMGSKHIHCFNVAHNKITLQSI